MIRMLWVLAGLAVAVLAVWFLDVFTWTGVGAAFWPWTDTTALHWPLGTRLVWWLGLPEVGVAAASVLVWREGRLECHSLAELWLASHVSVVQRLVRRVKHWTAGVQVAVEQHQRHRTAGAEQPVVARTEARDTTIEERAA